MGKGIKNLNLQMYVWWIGKGYIKNSNSLIVKNYYPAGERLCFPLNRHFYNVYDCRYILIASS